MKSKSITVVVGAFLILSIGVVFVTQGNRINEHKQVLAAKDVEIAKLNLSLDEEFEKVSQLNELNKVYKDSIIILNKQIYNLELQLKEKDKVIAGLKDKLKKQKIEYYDLKNKIAILYKKSKLNKAALKKLEKEKAKLKKDIEITEKKKQDQYAAKAVSQKTIEGYRRHVNNMSTVTDIVTNTRVTFTEISGRKFKSGRKIHRMRKNMSGWQYTYFKFSLQNPNHRTLLDRSFALKIYDTENNVPLAYIEQNPQFSNSSERGIPFQFDGNTIELTFCNMQKKLSENYEVRIVLLHNGEEIPLDNGVLPIVKNGKFK
ncbi:MAG: putative coiled-coil protein SlyX [Maribacter sp.]|jgi:uncharacterized coiled-coil protein SlyX